MATLGQAYVEVHADTRPFAKELKKEITSILKKLDVNVSAEGVKIGASLGKGVSAGLSKETDRSLLTWRERFVGWARRTGSEGGDAFEKAFRRMATGNFILFRVIGNLGERLISLSKSLVKVFGLVFDVAKAFGTLTKASLELAFEGIKFLVGATTDFSKVTSSVVAATINVGGALAALAASAPTAAAGIIAATVAAVALVSVLTALAAVLVVVAAPFAALLGFATAVPAALSVILAIVLPLVLALHDLGDALKLVFEQDPKKLADGLKKLSPTMRELVMNLRTVAPILKDIRDTVQRTFFGPIFMALAPAIKSIAPILRAGLEKASLAMGVFVANALSLLQDPAFQRFVQELFPTVARMIETLSFPLIHLMQALATATTAALPTLELLIGKLAGFIDDFATWIETTVADGRFQKFLDDAIAAATDIWNLIKALIGLFGQLFAQTEDGGRRFLEKITEAINKFTAWLKSPDGRAALQQAVVLALAFAEAFSIALSTIKVIVTQLSRAVSLATALLKALGVINEEGVTRTGTSLAHTNLPGYSGGGVVPYNQVAMVHQGEPILDPANSDARNRGILADAGMLDLLNQPSVVNVYIAGDKLYEHIDYRISSNNQSNARSMAHGPRGGR